MAHRFTTVAKIEGNAFERGCEGKVPYPSEAAAEAGMKFLQSQRVMRTNDGTVVYECQFCRKWHLGRRRP